MNRNVAASDEDADAKLRLTVDVEGRRLVFTDQDIEGIEFD